MFGIKVVKKSEIYKYGFDISFMTDLVFKSNEQNSLFHSLLSVFWDSGCSSFISYDDLRRYYKKMAGLIEYKYENNLLEQTKKILWRAIKILPLPKEEIEKITMLLKGRVEVERSWSSVSRKNAKIAIDRLINDMDASGVISSKLGKKYETILTGIGEIC